MAEAELALLAFLLETAASRDANKKFQDDVLKSKGNVNLSELAEEYGKQISIAAQIVKGATALLKKLNEETKKYGEEGVVGRLAVLQRENEVLQEAKKSLEERLDRQQQTIKDLVQEGVKDALNAGADGLVDRFGKMLLDNDALPKHLQAGIAGLDLSIDQQQLQDRLGSVLQDNMSNMPQPTFDQQQFVADLSSSLNNRLGDLLKESMSTKPIPQPQFDEAAFTSTLSRELKNHLGAVLKDNISSIPTPAFDPQTLVNSLTSYLDNNLNDTVQQAVSMLQPPLISKLSDDFNAAIPSLVDQKEVNKTMSEAVAEGVRTLNVPTPPFDQDQAIKTMSEAVARSAKTLPVPTPPFDQAKAIETMSKAVADSAKTLPVPTPPFDQAKAIEGMVSVVSGAMPGLTIPPFDEAFKTRAVTTIANTMKEQMALDIGRLAEEVTKSISKTQAASGAATLGGSSPTVTLSEESRTTLLTGLQALISGSQQSSGGAVLGGSDLAGASGTQVTLSATSLEAVRDMITQALQDVRRSISPAARFNTDGLPSMKVEDFFDHASGLEVTVYGHQDDLQTLNEFLRRPAWREAAPSQDYRCGFEALAISLSSLRSDKTREMIIRDLRLLHVDDPGWQTLVSRLNQQGGADVQGLMSPNNLTSEALQLLLHRIGPKYKTTYQLGTLAWSHEHEAWFAEIHPLLLGDSQPATVVWITNDGASQTNEANYPPDFLVLYDHWDGMTIKRPRDRSGTPGGRSMASGEKKKARGGMGGIVDRMRRGNNSERPTTQGSDTSGESSTLLNPTASSTAKQRLAKQPSMTTIHSSAISTRSTVHTLRPQKKGGPLQRFAQGAKRIVSGGSVSAIKENTAELVFDDVLGWGQEIIIGSGPTLRNEEYLHRSIVEYLEKDINNCRTKNMKRNNDGLQQCVWTTARKAASLGFPTNSGPCNTCKNQGDRQCVVMLDNRRVLVKGMSEDPQTEKAQPGQQNEDDEAGSEDEMDESEE